MNIHSILGILCVNSGLGIGPFTSYNIPPNLQNKAEKYVVPTGTHNIVQMHDMQAENKHDMQANIQQCKHISKQTKKHPINKQTKARIDSLRTDQHRSNNVPSRVASCRYREKWIRVATNIFIPSRERNIRNLTRNKNKVFQPENRARESVTRGEGASTPHAHRTRWYPPMFVSI